MAERVQARTLASVRETIRWALAGVLTALTVIVVALPSSGAAAAAPMRPLSETPGTGAGASGGASAPRRDVIGAPGGPLPVGKGMWVHVLARAEGGDVAAIVAKAKASGLTHLYVRVGSSADGFYGGADLTALLPAAHAAGLRVVGWDFPTLADPYRDADRAASEVWFTTAGGDRLDAFSADIETAAEGTHLSSGAARAYGANVRAAAGAGFPLIATVPRPGPHLRYPYGEVVADFDAVAPMVYWGRGDPDAQVRAAIRALAPLGKPVLPVGQAYDGAIDHGPSGAPSGADLRRFITAAAEEGAVGASFWVWDTASAEHWAAIAAAPELTLSASAERGAVRFAQRVLNATGHPTIEDGVLGASMAAALDDVQRRSGLPGGGVLDGPTIAALGGVAP